MWRKRSQNCILSEGIDGVRTNQSRLGRFLRDYCSPEVPSWPDESSVTKRHMGKNLSKVCYRLPCCSALGCHHVNHLSSWSPELVRTDVADVSCSLTSHGLQPLLRC